MNRITLPDLEKCNNIERNKSKQNGNKTTHQPLKKTQSLKNGSLHTNNIGHHRCNSVSSESSLFTTLSRADGYGNRIENIENTNMTVDLNKLEVNKKHKNKINDNHNHHNRTTLNTIAEKLGFNTKKNLLIKTSSPIIISTGEVETSSEMHDDGNSLNHLNVINVNQEKNKESSIESTHTNTISNSSLQELDEEEFTSSELARYMGEVNNEIRQDRNM